MFHDSSFFHHTMLPILNILPDTANHIRVTWDGYKNTNAEAPPPVILMSLVWLEAAIIIYFMPPISNARTINLCSLHCHDTR